MKPTSLLRLLSLAGATLALALSTQSGQAQEWSQYLAFDDRFSVDFPTDPSVEETTYETEYGFTLPARIYTAEDDFGTYSVTAVDWSEAETLHTEAFDACESAIDDLRGGDNPGHCSRLYYEREIRGAALHAAFGLIERGSEVTHLGSANTEMVEGIGIQLLNEDGSRWYAVLFWHNYHLFIANAIAPQGMPPPLLFSTSLGFLDEQGRRITYGERYAPLYPVPHRTR
ncbi:MAG: hypothetical protein F4053_09525 [Proteobacteria bacterium]|nr:hypothetical protein [Pseudomonadota bacterium]